MIENACTKQAESQHTVNSKTCVQKHIYIYIYTYIYTHDSMLFEACTTRVKLLSAVDLTKPTLNNYVYIYNYIMCGQMWIQVYRNRIP